MQSYASPLIRQCNTTILWLSVLLASVLLLSACAHQPDDVVIANALQSELDAALGGRILQVESVRRSGSAGAIATAPGGVARLIYFNSRLRFVRDYDFSRWESHSVSTLRDLLGVGPNGIKGMKPEGNNTGDQLIVYGALEFEQKGDSWNIIAGRRTNVEPNIDASTLAVELSGRERNGALSSATEFAFERLRELATTSPDQTPTSEQREHILTEELERAYRNARQRLEQNSTSLTLAAGPVDSSYAEISQLLNERADASDLSLAVSGSDGSADSIRLLVTDQVQFALAQNDMAAAAYAGHERYGGSTSSALRAVASLYPEPIHLVASTRSGIRKVADLRGKRVAIGAEYSGTRQSVLTVLAAAGVPLESLRISNAPLVEASAELAAGRIDALFAVVHLPAQALTQLASQTPLRWIPIASETLPPQSGLIPFELPALTYPGQTDRLPTVAATVLMLTRADVPAATVQSMLQLLFDTPDPRRAQSAPLAQINRRTAHLGIHIPWSPIAESFLTESMAASTR
jgi:TRAP transporter TAXI family solute receptor